MFLAAIGGFAVGRWGHRPTPLESTPQHGRAQVTTAKEVRLLPSPTLLAPPSPVEAVLSGRSAWTPEWRETNNDDLSALDQFFRQAVRSGEDNIGPAYAGSASALSAAEVEVALDAIRRWPAGPRRAAAESMLVRRWGQLDPAAALAWVANLAEPMRRHELRRQTILGWASVRPAEALAYVEANADGAPTAHRLRDVFEGAMHADTDTTLRFAQQLDLTRFRNEASALIWTVFGRDPVATLAFVEALPDSDLRRLATDRVIDHWARYDPASARIWMERMVAPDQRLSAQIELGESWARLDPVSAVNWFLDLPPEEQNSRILDRILYRWMQYDPDACSQWLQVQPPSPLLDRVRAERAVAMTRRNVEEALVWARQIMDERRRTATEEQIIWDWYRRDRAAAVDYALHRSNLPETTRQRLLERARRDAEREAARQ